MKPAPPSALLFLLFAACASRPPSYEEHGPEPAPAQPVEVHVLTVEAPAQAMARWIDPQSVKIVTPAVADEMIAALRKDGHVASRPSILVQPGATASMSTTNRVDVAGASTSDGKPIEEGCWIELTPVPADDGRIDVAFSIATAAFVRLVRESEGTEQVPLMREEHRSSRVTLAPDEVALLPIDRQPAADGTVRCAVLRVARAAPDRIQRL